MFQERNIDTKVVGRAGEELAKQYFEKLGWQIIATNYHLPFGEIDILAKDHQTIVIVEVKAKTNLHYGLPQEEVNAHKQAKLRKLAHRISQDYPDQPIRIDVLAIDYSSVAPKIDHIINAVEA